MSTTTVTKVIEEFDRLSLQDEEYILEVMEKQLIEKKRENIFLMSKEAMSNLKKGLVKKGTLKHLYKDLESD